MRMSKCKGCGAEIIWIKTEGGKSIPCNALKIVYRQARGGSLKIVTPNGEVVSGELAADPQTATGVGYVSHFATCPMADAFRGMSAGKAKQDSFGIGQK